MKAKLLSGAGLLVALVALIGINVFSNVTFTSARLDLTEQGAYTLSQGTKNTLAAIDEPVTLRLFLSERLATENPSVTTYANRVKDMLLEYQRRAGNRLRVEFIDPEPFSEDEDRAVGYGLHGIPLDAEGSNFYFGLVGSNSTDDEVVVPYLSMDREEFLEYDLTKVLWQLLDTKTPVAAIMSTLPINGMDQQMAMMMRQPPTKPWVAIEQLGETFELRDLQPTAEAIPDDIDVLLLVHPKNLGDTTLYAIDQFVMRGGRLLVFVDPNAEMDRPNPMMPGAAASRSSSLDKLFSAWGIGYEPGKFVADLQHALRVRFQRDGRLITVDYPAWIELPQSLFDQKDPVTSNLGKLVFGSAGALTFGNVEGLTFTPLVRSSDQAMLMDTAMLEPSRDPQEMLREYRPAGEAYVLAARLSGTPKSAFVDGPPKSAGGDDKAATDSPTPATPKAAHLAAASAPTSIVIVADTDVLADRFWVQVQELLGTRLAVPSAGNGSFLANALDNLTGSSDLISVRSRGRYTRPFTRVEDIRREAELQFREKEQQLTQELAQTEEKLVDLERAKPQGGTALVLSDAQAAEIDRFRQQKLRVRKELREVLHERRKSIDSLEFTLRLVNIALMPALIILAGILVAVWQMQRRRTLMAGRD